MASDAPDYQRVVVLEVSAMSDANDWEEVVVGPGGTPISGGAGQTSWAPADFGYKGWSESVFNANFTTGGPTSGHVYLSPFKVAATGTISTLYGYCYSTTGTHFTASQNFFGFYSVGNDGSGNLEWTLAATSAAGAYEADVAPDLYAVPLSTGLAVTAGQVLYAAILLNYTGSAPSFVIINTNLWYFGLVTVTAPAQISGWATTGGNTALPATILTAALGARLEAAYWFGGA